MAQERIPQGGALAVYDPMTAVGSQLRSAGIDFQALLGGARELGKKGQVKYSALGGTPALAGRYMPLAGVGLSLIADPTNIGGAAGTGIGGAIGAGLGTPLGPLGMFAGSALGSAIGGGLGTALQKGLVGGAKAAVDTVTGARREEGKSGLFGGGVGDLDAGKINELAKSLGMTQVEVAEKLIPSYNAMRNADVNRQMQLNQQLGQLTGALNQQKYMAQLAGGAQSEAGATTRSILTAANPYAQSAFQYRG
jgi:hypothetical protein